MAGQGRGAGARAIVAVIGVVAVGALAAPAPAAPSARPAGFALDASNGYSLFVAGIPARKGNPASVLVDVSGPGGAADYFAPAVVTDSSIQADLGALGKIDVSFHPSGIARREHSACDDRAVFFDSGSYEGKVDFHGEEGYTSVEATSARGEIRFLLNLVCGGASGGFGPFDPGAELDLNKGRPGLPRLRVVKNGPGAPAHYEVGVSEVQEGIVIERFSDPVESPGTFRYDPKLRTATVRPTAPFSGVAHYRRDAKPANRWTGNLSVDLPGRSDVALTGPEAKIALRHARW